MRRSWFAPVMLAGLFAALSGVAASAALTAQDQALVGANADHDNWHLHGRTYDNQRFSPLMQHSSHLRRQRKRNFPSIKGIADSK
jgi:glucose dehydrogenase